MAFQPEKITRDHVKEAAKIIDSGEYIIPQSTGYDAIVEGKKYPPKELMRFAHQQATGDYEWYPGGGEPTNKYLKALDFEVIEKNKGVWLDIIQDYKNLIRKNGNENGIYKWKLISTYFGRPDTTAPNFYDEIRSIKFQNLIFHNGIAALEHMTRVYPEDVRECFKNLFDENTSLDNRIDTFTKDTLAIYRKVEQRVYHHQDERTIATYLTFKFPDKYTFYKNSFYRKLCKRLNIKPDKKGKKYLHYLSLVGEFINDYLLKDKELLELKQSFLTEDCYSDENNLIYAQDILYQALENPLQFQRSYWRIGTSIDDEAQWQKMKSGQFVAIGWDRLGDLNELDISNRKEMQKLLQEKNYYVNENRVASTKAGEIFSFYDEIKVGDIVLAQDGQRILGVGVVKDEYNYDEKSNPAPHQHEVDWLFIEPHITNKEGLRTTVYQLSDVDLIKQIDTLINRVKTSKDLAMNKNKRTLNQILFGPPGTGKTYNSINYALEILGEDIKDKKREDVKRLFDTKVKEGRIMFTTFHQSMSYEDFIEGIKPLPPEDTDGQVGYDIISGIFKNICENAHSKSSSNFDEAYNSFLSEIAALDGEPFELKTPTNKPFYVRINSKNNLSLLTGKEKKQQGVFTKEKIHRQLNGEKVFIGWEGYSKAIVSYLENKHKLTASKSSTENKNNNYVLIIDEINRGNVSQIFGELITLIEEDKRENKTETLKITLPYSQEIFSVPDNLYIIGTMNTADRSVEALDTALRRRFSFIEMPPDIQVLKDKKDGQIKGDELANLLTVINTRLEKLLGKDHLIGHSFFLSVNNDEDLKFAFQHKIIPLLQEYFYGDYGKIGLVLGRGFVKVKEIEGEIFSEFEYEADTLKEKVVYELIDFTKNDTPHSITLKDKKVDVNFDIAIKLLLNQPVD